MKSKQFYKLLLLLLVVSFPCFSQYNYGEALQKSIFFYEAQQSGEIPDWNRVTWRGNSGMDDGSDVQIDLTGGWYDAGDHVKFGFPMAYSTTVLAWGMIEYKDAYENSGQLEQMKKNLRFVCDYFIKCHTAPNEFYGQVGKGSADHAWWGSAEVMPMTRPAYKITTAKPGSDLAGETAAALAAASMVFADSDPSYSATLITHAEQLYSFADTYRGKYSDAITDAADYYKSWSGYQDEIVWGAIWLYKATGNATYLTKAESEYSFLGNEGQTNFKAYKWGLAWDDKSYGSYVLLADITGKQKYKSDSERHLDYWTTGFNGERIAYSPGGQAHLTTWGSLRHSANTAFLAFVYSDKVPSSKASTYHNFAVNQINYILGDNPSNRSYVVGFGNNPPKNPHHRTAHGTWTNNLVGPPTVSRHTLYGALVGGPGAANDQYTDDRGDYIANEVACDYNAGFTGALARMYNEFGGTPLANFPIEETPTNEFLADAKFNSSNQYGVTVSVMARNHTAWPARAVKKLSFKYFFNISEGVAAGYSINDYNINLSYSQGSSSLVVKPWDEENHVYYAEVSFPGENVAPAGQSESRREAQINIQVSHGMPWDISNDYSAIGLSGNTRINSTKIPMYNDGELIHGVEAPGGNTPKASFTASSTNAPAPATISFDASSSTDPNGDVLTYTWNFGDGTTASGVTVTHTYTTAANYTVKLTVSDGVNTDDETKTVKITSGAPIAKFTTDQDVYVAPTTAFFDASNSIDPNGDALTYSWDFGDGTTATGVTVSHSYINIGDYSVVLTVSDGNETGTKTKVLKVTDGAPVAAFSVSDTQGTAPLTVSFDASDSADPSGTGLLYTWDFGNGQTGSGETITTTYTDAGTYTATLTVINPYGVDVATKVITVEEPLNCGFGAPLATPLPNIGNKQYNNAHVLGNGGPNLSNLNNFTINWDLQNNGLYQFSILTTNGVPAWWNDLLPKVSQSFNQAEPEVTISGSGFADLDGTYWVTMDGNNFVMVSKNGGFTIYFSNSSQAPSCESSARAVKIENTTSKTKSLPVMVKPNPATTYLDVLLSRNDVMSKGLHKGNIRLLNVSGQVLKTYSFDNQQKIRISIEDITKGFYILEVENNTTGERTTRKILVK
ncbi:glycoside hydrolase family 9 protein [Tenacibaculum amylolyticum]|uniref:glycoside hydrolase family 9 protein n=1 Tax=Tenacibaculum amylolyticum TaxID=104269 RepID=UPI00389656B0